MLPEPESEDAETLTRCPACNGSTFAEIAPLRPGMYRVVQCFYCNGEGLVSATKKVSYTRLRAIFRD